MARIALSTTLAATLAATVAGTTEAEQVSALGIWTVTGVEADPSMPVTAVATDDPAYLGARLTVTSERISWDTGAANGEGTYDDCDAPRFAAGAGGIAVTCDGAPWGPGGVLTPLSATALRLGWYDGGLLVLTRD